MERNSFACKEGRMVFFIPFTFSKEGSFWDECFNESDLKNNSAQVRKAAYEEGKKAVIKRLKAQEATLFNDAAICFPVCARGREYSGTKNLCSCMSVTNKFHDDASQKALRTELFLSTHKIVYEYPNGGNPVSFSFGLDVYLSINKEDNICFLILRTGLDTIENDGILKCSTGSDVSDKVIFWKHIFYKERLKVKIDGGNNPTSLRKWATWYLETVHKALKIDPTLNIRDKNGIYFSYSMVELDNVSDVEGKVISLRNIDSFMQNYSHQLYGLLVSDEGWRYVPDKYIENKFKDRYHSSRDHIYSFFIGQNALIINQCEAEGGKEYSEFGKEWFKKYTQDSRKFSYGKYFTANPCIPGLINHLFQIFMKSIYKNLMLERIMNDSDGETSIRDLENKIEKLTGALESHSVLLGEAQSIKDCVHKEFGLNEKWQKVNERYLHKINSLNTQNDKKQNNKIDILTRFTIVLALLTLIFSLTDPDPYTIIKFTREYAPWVALLAIVATACIANERIGERWQTRRGRRKIRRKKRRDRRETRRALRRERRMQRKENKRNK